MLLASEPFLGREGRTEFLIDHQVRVEPKTYA